MYPVNGNIPEYTTNLPFTRQRLKHFRSQAEESERPIAFHRTNVRWLRLTIITEQTSPASTARWFPFPSTRANTATRVRVESFNSGGVDLEDWVSVAESIECFDVAPRTIDRIKLAGRCALSHTSRMTPTVLQNEAPST